MKTYSGLALAAAIAAAAGGVYVGLPASATPPPDRPALPPLVLDPGAVLPTPAPADMTKAAPKKAEPPLPVAPPAKLELPPLPVVPPAPLPVPMPVVPAAKADPTKLPAVPPPPVVPLPAPPVAQPLPSVPPPVAAPKLPAVPPPPVVAPPAPLPIVPPPVSVDPKAQPLPAPLPIVPPPFTDAPKAAPLPAPRAELPPQPLPPPLPVTPAAPPAVGSVVVLHDGKVVEGHVSRTADKVIVRRGVIDQPFPKDQVKYVAASKDEAYRLALKDTKLDEPAARLRLARWCMFNGMRENALTEAKEAVRLEPANRTAAELARTLDESLRLYPGDGTTRVTATPVAPPSPMVPPPAPGLPAVPPPPVVPPVVTVPQPDIAPEAVVAFGPRVQPVLMNQCASCHAKAEHAGAFKLAPVATNETNPTATRANLAAAAAQLKKADPAASPLLAKALAAHGGQTAPAFADRDAAAFRVLYAWAYLAAGELAPPVAAVPPPPVLQPTPRPDAPAADVRPMLPPPPPLPVVPAPAPPPIPPAVGSLPPLPVAPAPLPVPPPIPPATGDGFGQSAPPPVPTGPAQDEFDPVNFNRR